MFIESASEFNWMQKKEFEILKKKNISSEIEPCCCALNALGHRGQVIYTINWECVRISHTQTQLHCDVFNCDWWSPNHATTASTRCQNVGSVAIACKQIENNFIFKKIIASKKRDKIKNKNEKIKVQSLKGWEKKFHENRIKNSGIKMELSVSYSQIGSNYLNDKM